MRFTEHQVMASICRESFYEFVKEFWHTIIHDKPVFNWHIKVLCDEMQRMAMRVFRGEKKLGDLLINVPPGSTKSTICSQMFVAWVWTRMPHAQFICVSYAETSALKDAEHSRDIIRSDLYRACFPEIQIRKDKEAKSKFENTKGGWRMAVGMDGMITGEHAHFIMIDDPIDPKKALSEAERLSVDHVMNGILPTRVTNREVSVFVLIMQRVHQADPAGEWMKRKGVIHICLPAELTEDVRPSHLAKFYKDGLLDPVRYPREVLNDFASPFKLGEYGYSAQMLQRPVPPGGGMFKIKKFNRVNDPRHWKDICKAMNIVRVIRSWDKAGTEGGGCFTVGVLMGVDKHGRLWILDVVRGQWRSIEREKKILECAIADGEQVVIRVEIEGGSGGKESGEATVRNLHGFYVICYHPTGEKEVRAQPYSSMVNGGQVFILERAWTEPYLAELEYFPFGKYKDQVDPSADGCNYLAKQKRKVGAL
jgi:predicted phage terminase large subunit-like protein